MRGMFAAISGLRSHQLMLDVTANDIANVNTVGFKANRVTFKDALLQNIKGSSAPSGTLGGTNGLQVGLGVQVNSIDNVMGSGAIQTTGSPLDLAIQGDGLFRVGQWNAGTSTFSNVLYTRAGNFQLDASGNLVTADGYFVVGHAAATQGPPPTFGATDGIITIPTTAKSVSIGQDGVVSYVNAATGVTTFVAQITMAKFPNAAGLDRAGASKWTQSNNSGVPVVGFPGDTNGNGILAPGSLEMSNVDLAQEFTTLITAQRGFQANSRVITTADEMLTELVNLKR